MTASLQCKKFQRVHKKSVSGGVHCLEAKNTSTDRLLMHLNLSAGVPIWLNITGPAAEIAELSRRIATAAAKSGAYVGPDDSPPDLRSRIYSACVSAGLQQVCNSDDRSF